MYSNHNTELIMELRLHLKITQKLSKYRIQYNDFSNVAYSSQ